MSNSAPNTNSPVTVDRILIDAINDWLDEDQLPHQREWVVELAGDQLTWKRIRRLAESAGIEAEGFFNGQPGLPDARAARRALRYLRATVPELEAVVLIRDQDDQTDRRDGLEAVDVMDAKLAAVRLLPTNI